MLFFTKIAMMYTFSWAFEGPSKQAWLSASWIRFLKCRHDEGAYDRRGHGFSEGRVVGPLWKQHQQFIRWRSAQARATHRAQSHRAQIPLFHQRSNSEAQKDVGRRGWQGQCFSQLWIQSTREPFAKARRKGQEFRFEVAGWLNSLSRFEVADSLNRLSKFEVAGSMVNQLGASGVQGVPASFFGICSKLADEQVCDSSTRHWAHWSLGG